MSMSRHITLPEGFIANAVCCGLKRSGRDDLAVIAADPSRQPVSAAIVTTRNQVVGAPVRWCRQILPKGYAKVRAVVVNAGNSNVCNGKRGDRDAAKMAALTARALNCEAAEVLVCSTGVIGHPLPMDKISAGITAATGSLSRHRDQAVAGAIMTTDTFAKSAVVQTEIDGQTVNICGIAKGSGMIAPSLATMLCFITTDANIAPALLHKTLCGATDTSFNAITVDSDTSTSDTVIVMASGEGKKRISTQTPAALKKFSAALTEVCTALAESIARDGEGATKLVRVTVSGAANDEDARIAAKTIADSPLVKCAVHGGDPNWGRILAAAGRSAARVDQDKASCKIGPVTVMRRGTSCKFDQAAAESHMAGKEISLELKLGLGKGKFTALTCDLSREYITINADYHT